MTLPILKPDPETQKPGQKALKTASLKPLTADICDEALFPDNRRRVDWGKPVKQEFQFTKWGMR